MRALRTDRINLQEAANDTSNRSISCSWTFNPSNDFYVYCSSTLSCIILFSITSGKSLVIILVDTEVKTNSPLKVVKIANKLRTHTNIFFTININRRNYYFSRFDVEVDLSFINIFLVFVIHVFKTYYEQIKIKVMWDRIRRPWLPTKPLKVHIYGRFLILLIYISTYSIAPAKYK